jgi:hypothetical protein
MQRESNQARPRGTGSLLRHRQRSGEETWYGKWRVNGRRVMRALGPVRVSGSKTGLTRLQAEATLRQAIEATQISPQAGGGLELAEAGRRYLENRETVGLKPGTLSDYESYLRVHLIPFFAGRSLEQIDPEQIEAFIAAKRQEGKAPKSIINYLGLLGAIFTHAVRRNWCSTNPVALVDTPRNRRGKTSATSPSTNSKRSWPRHPTTHSGARSECSTSQAR